MNGWGTTFRFFIDGCINDLERMPTDELSTILTLGQEDVVRPGSRFALKGFLSDTDCDVRLLETAPASKLRFIISSE